MEILASVTTVEAHDIWDRFLSHSFGLIRQLQLPQLIMLSSIIWGPITA
jgi:hypothetical protein